MPIVVRYWLFWWDLRGVCKFPCDFIALIGIRVPLSQGVIFPIRVISICNSALTLYVTTVIVHDAVLYAHARDFFPVHQGQQDAV